MCFKTISESIKADESLDETWITVFGFPPSATSYILQEFSIHGQILKYIVSIIWFNRNRKLYLFDIF